MRLSDLLDAAIVDPDGKDLGRVHDVRLVKDGPLLEAFGAALTIEGLVFGKAGLGDRLGFDRAEVHGPPLLKWAFQKLHRHNRLVPWDQVTAIEGRRIHIASPLEELPEVEEL